MKMDDSCCWPNKYSSEEKEENHLHRFIIQSMNFFSSYARWQIIWRNWNCIVLFSEYSRIDDNAFQLHLCSFFISYLKGIEKGLNLIFKAGDLIIFTFFRWSMKTTKKNTGENHDHLNGSDHYLILRLTCQVEL